MTNKNGQMNAARRFYLHTPSQASQSYVHWAEKLASEPGISYGCILDKYLIPLHPGDLMAVVARPGHGKSSWMAYMAKREALNIIKRKAQEEEAVIYITFEQPIEEVEAFFQAGDAYSSTDMAWGRAPLEKVKQRAVKRVNLPIWTIGNSLRHANVQKPTLDLAMAYQAIESMYDEYKMRPTLICLDYLQIVPAKGAERRDKVSEAAYASKQLAMQVGAPILAGVQAGRRVDDYRAPLPTMADAQWSSAIEQTADKQISLWRPAKTHSVEEHATVEVGGVDYQNSEGLFVIKLLKQRFERGFGVWAVQFKPDTLEMHDYSVRELAL